MSRHRCYQVLRDDTTTQEIKGTRLSESGERVQGSLLIHLQALDRDGGTVH